MKNILFIIIISMLLLTGCFNDKKRSESDDNKSNEPIVNETKEEKFNRLILEYYDNVFKEDLEDDLIEIEFTLKHLKNYMKDLPDFDNCNDESKVVLTIGEEKNVIIKQTNLICDENE